MEKRTQKLKESSRDKGDSWELGNPFIHLNYIPALGLWEKPCVLKIQSPFLLKFLGFSFCHLQPRVQINTQNS